MKRKFLTLFFLTLLLSFFIRVYRLTENPEGFDQTEASFAYNAYSILKTGRDEYGKFMPLILMSFGDYKLSGYAYWEIPFIFVFGLNEFAVRLSTVTAGLVSLILIYYIASKIFRDRKLALLTFFFTGIAPWHIVLSRMAYDPLVAVAAYLASIALFLRWQEKRKMNLLVLSSGSLCFSLVTYYAAWVIVPFTVLVFWVLLHRLVGWRSQLIRTSLVYTLPFMMMATLLWVTKGERLQQDSTYQIHAQPLLEEQIREDQHEFPLLVTRMFHNKAVFYPQFLLGNLFKNLSFDFLFLRGDKLDRRFYIPFHGVMYLWTAPFLLLGILYFWKKETFAKNIFVLGSILLIFLGSAFSEFGSETERTIFGVPFFGLLTSYGVLIVYRAIRRYHWSYFFWGCMGVGLVFNMAYFNHQYFWHANVHEPWRRDFGMREMITSLPLYKDKYKEVVIPDYAYTFYYFYNQTDPRVAWKDAKNRLDRKNYLGLTLRARVGEYLSMPIECPAAGKLNVLYVCRGTKLPPNAKVIQHISYRDDQPAFTLLEFLPTRSTEPLPRNTRNMDKFGVLEEGSEVFWKEESEI